MTAVRISRLSRPGVLESIDPERLFALLHPYADFFANRYVPIEAPGSIDCQAVIREIAKADRETPADLLDAISLIDELANTVAVDLLLFGDNWFSALATTRIPDYEFDFCLEALADGPLDFACLAVSTR